MNPSRPQRERARPSRPLWAAFGALALCLVVLAPGCGDSSVPTPFHEDAGADSDAADATDSDAADSTLGPPCADDAQCNDSIDCTFDDCDESIGRCVFSPDDSQCQDETFCDGLEVCDPMLGCREGVAVACDDNATCTIDTCIEAEKNCKNELRDADQDGDGDWSCGGGDCNDLDPMISSLELEVCGNGVDDDCDGAKDETGCSTPKYDKCAGAFPISATGTYVVPLAAAASDYSASCATGSTTYRDVVVAVVVPQGPAQDVDIIATTVGGALALAGVAQCGVPGSEFACAPGYALDKGGSLSRLRLRSLSPGAYAIYVFGAGSGDVALNVKYLPASQKPSHETCGTASPLSPGVSLTTSVIDAAEDVASECVTPLGELVYELTLAQSQDVDVWATSLDGNGKPGVALLQGDCSKKADELACNVATQAHVFARALPAGTYYVTVTATVPTDLDLLAELHPPTVAPKDESCASGAVLSPNVSVPVPLAAHTDDVKLGCIAGAADAAYTVDLPVASDVLLVGRISDQDSVGLSWARPPCASADALACVSSSETPVRTRAHNQPAGSYRAVIESTTLSPTILTAFTRPATPPTLVPFADTCQTAVKIPSAGGFFQGNTGNANADYVAGCDLGSQPAGGAPDQMLKLELSAKKRVVLDMRGSNYATLLAVRRAESCPGPEVAQACAAGYSQDRSFLDLTLDAGAYWVQIDGYAGYFGQWFLDVFIVDP
ncbi:MAG: putative metal-binding motif-containing protein [Polyangiaceae bacterium]